jgi:hypothetical protein
MERLCLVCNQIKNSPYKNICRSCYQIKWEKTLNKTCPDCNVKFKKGGKYCCNCARSRRLKERGQQTCSKCCRKGLLIINIGLNLCTKCERIRKDIEIPGYKENRMKVNRRFSRKYKGWNDEDLDKPPKEKSTGKWKNKEGYIILYKKGHPNSNKNDCIQEHTYVMSNYLNRPLMDRESVHHKNGIRDDNRIENLELWHRSQPSGQRVIDKITYAIEILEQYGYKINKDYTIKI